MRKVLFISLFLLGVISCGNNQQNKEQAILEVANTQNTDTSIVNIYYFHGKQRCKTCIAVGNLAKETIETAYKGNTRVKFTEIETSDKTYNNLVEKYEVTWNALIIAKGENYVDITDDAFSYALNNPEIVSELIKKEIDKNLN